MDRNIHSITNKYTWLKYLVVGAVCHVESTQFDRYLIASSLAYGEGHFDYVGLRVLKNLLGDRDIQSRLDMSDVDPQSHGPMCREGLSILIEQLEAEKLDVKKLCQQSKVN